MTRRFIFAVVPVLALAVGGVACASDPVVTADKGAQASSDDGAESSSEPGATSAPAAVAGPTWLVREGSKDAPPPDPEAEPSSEARELTEADRALIEQVRRMVPTETTIDTVRAGVTEGMDIVRVMLDTPTGRISVTWQTLQHPVAILPPEGTPDEDRLGTYEKTEKGELVTINRPDGPDGFTTGYEVIHVSPEGDLVKVLYMTLQAGERGLDEGSPEEHAPYEQLVVDIAEGAHRAR